MQLKLIKQQRRSENSEKSHGLKTANHLHKTLHLDGVSQPELINHLRQSPK